MTGFVTPIAVSLPNMLLRRSDLLGKFFTWPGNQSPDYSGTPHGTRRKLAEKLRPCAVSRWLPDMPVRK